MDFNLSRKTVLLTACISIAAYGLTLASTAWCSFVERDVEIADDDAFSDVQGRLRDLLLEDHGVGFWGWELDGSCFDYSIGGEDPDFDTKYNSARAFTIVCAILGGIVMFSLLFSCCRAPGARSFLCYAFFAKLTCLFQGLTLLIFKSDICEPGFFGYRPGADDVDLEGVSVDCKLSSGSKCAISATALWFVVSVMCTYVAKEGMKASKDEDEPPMDEEVDAEKGEAEERPLDEA